MTINPIKKIFPCHLQFFSFEYIFNNFELQPTDFPLKKYISLTNLNLLQTQNPVSLLPLWRLIQSRQSSSAQHWPLARFLREETIINPLNHSARECKLQFEFSICEMFCQLAALQFVYVEW